MLMPSASPRSDCQGRIHHAHPLTRSPARPLTLATLAMIAAPAFAQRDLPPEARELPAFVPGSMWVKLDTDQPQVHETTMRVVRALAGVEQTKTYWLVPGLHLVRVPVGDERAFVSLLRDLEGVEWTSLEGVGSVTQAPPTCVQPSSNCEDANCADQYWVRKVNLHRAWKLLEGKELPEVVVAVMDSGVNYAHPDLAANMWQNPGEVAGIAGIDDDSNGVVDDVYGAAFVVPSPFEICNSNCGAYQFCPTCPNVGEPPQICTWCDQAGNPAEPPFYNGGEIQCLTSTPPSGDGGHGTACASIIASTANSIGVRGFGCNLRIMGIRLWHWCNDRGFAESSFVEGLQYAVYNGAGVISNSTYLPSIGGSGQAMEAAIIEVGAHDIVFVTSAGNLGKNVDDLNETGVYPPQRVNASHVINVGGTTASDSIASFSNYGSNIIDLMAPAVGIRTYTNNAESSGGFLDGTSFSTPMVAGAAAMYRARNPGASASDVRNAVNATVRVVPSLQSKC